jgi:hypothetical protein
MYVEVPNLIGELLELQHIRLCPTFVVAIRSRLRDAWNSCHAVKVLSGQAAGESKGGRTTICGDPFYSTIGSNYWVIFQGGQLNICRVLNMLRLCYRLAIYQVQCQIFS